MKVTKESIVSGVVHTMDLPITDDQLYRWKQGEVIQNVMPHLSNSQREFLISGMTDEEWDDLFEEGK